MPQAQGGASLVQMLRERVRSQREQSSAHNALAMNAIDEESEQARFHRIYNDDSAWQTVGPSTSILPIAGGILPS